MKPTGWLTPADKQELNVYFDTTICPSHHNVWWQTDGTPSPVIYPYQFVYMQRALEKAKGASRFTALKLMVGARGGGCSQYRVMAKKEVSEKKWR